MEAFLADGAKAPQKYIMSLAGLLGDDDLLDYLKKLFTTLFEDNRLKMAQYVINTVALIGSIKALRFIDFVSKKYKRKASLLATAKESLDIFAKEQGISMYELLDRLLPDFGFDGLYRLIDIEGQEYRVFVGKDFKLFYLNEDNKSRKSLPPKASKELKLEIKEIQKELREANKSQKERLEEYMIIQRRWSLSDWEEFYLSNPLMFVYASTLLWAEINEDNSINQLFYVDEDGSVLDSQDDEIELDGDKNITIIHSLRLDDEQKKIWGESFYDREIVQPFEQLNRIFYHISEDEKTQKSLTRYTGKKPNKSGSMVKSILESRGWQKDIVDAGSIDFYKDFIDENIRINLGVSGINISYFEGYDDWMEIYDTTFTKINDYTQQTRLKNIPEIIFSELIRDMEMVMG